MNPTYLIVLLLALAACKPTQRVKTGNVPDASRSTSTASSAAKASPYIASMNTRYIVKDSASVTVYLDLIMEDFKADETALKRFGSQFRASWLEVSDYNNIRERLKTGKLDVESSTFDFVENHVFVNFKIPRPKGVNSCVLITEFVDVVASKKFTIDVPIDFINARFINRYGVYKGNESKPTFDNFIQVGESIAFKAALGYERPFYLMRFEGDNAPARSPMSTTKPSITAFERKSVQQYTTDKPLIINETGLYFAVEDTTDTSLGSGFYVVDDRYPRLTMPDELSEPTIYISTNTEIENFKASSDAKQALDVFFLEMTNGNQALAKEVIRSYYRRVTEANRLFTSYKEGWKTDKGMVYIVLGPPSKVQRFRDREVWLYSQSERFSEIIFTFYRTNNQFTDNYYELVRYPDYKQYWYPYVEAWRNGKILE